MESPSLNSPSGRPLREQGFSLVEIIVALAIFSSGLGGLSLLLLLAIQQTAASRFQTAAVSRAHSMSEFILASPKAAQGSLDPVESSACLEGDMCSPGIMMSAALHAWRQQLGEELPGGDGVACRDTTPHDGMPGSPGCDGAGPVVVKVFWQEPATGEAATPVPHRVVARLPLL